MVYRILAAGYYHTDTVSHPELLCKLRKAGVCGDLWFWFQDFLSGRVQHVSINNSILSSLSIISGVPQGSIATGSSLYLIFINDLPSEDLHYYFSQMTQNASLLLLSQSIAICFSVTLTDCRSGVQIGNSSSTNQSALC